MAEGLSRSQIASRPRSLSELLVTPPEGRAETAAEVTRLLQAATVAATAPDSTEASRIAAIELLPHLPPGTLQAAVTQLLTAQNSSSVQRALLQAIRRSGHPSIAGRVIEHWDGLHPQARASALDLLLLRPESTRQLLQAMSAGSIPSSAISIDQRLALLQHPDAEIATAAAAMFGGAVSADRRQVIDGYRAALTLAGDATRGAEVFEKSCSKCHRIGSVGHHVGPDLSDTRARARDALLYDILDPNRRVDPQYGECVVVTADGRVFSGLLVNESHASITLRQPEGREETLLRSDIEELRTSGKSLMPEGLEKDLTVGQIADVLTFLKDR
jgi:putative heme-binding domain-containing protein